MMRNVPPDIALKAVALKAKYAPFVRDLSPQFVHKVIREAEKYSGVFLGYWRSEDTAYLVIYRLDRAPSDIEVWPWLQALFGSDNDGVVHEWSYSNFRFFYEGNVYNTDTVADSIANAFVDAAERDSNAEAFDFAKTDLGRRLKDQRNGR